jgi:hypothetical protein
MGIIPSVSWCLASGLMFDKMNVQLTTHVDARAFLHASQTDLEWHEVEHSLILGVALALQSAPAPPETVLYLATVCDAAGLVAAAIMTPPHPLILASDRNDCNAALIHGHCPRPAEVQSASFRRDRSEAARGALCEGVVPCIRLSCSACDAAAPLHPDQAPAHPLPTGPTPPCYQGGP